MQEVRDNLKFALNPGAATFRRSRLEHGMAAGEYTGAPESIPVCSFPVPMSWPEPGRSGTG